MLGKYKEYLSIPELKKRNWTDTLIKKFLGNPDITKPNPYYSSAAPMGLYSLARVEEIEQSTIWEQQLYKTQLRKQSAEKAVQTKRQNLLTALENLQIVVPYMLEDNLIKEACKHYNNRKEECDEWIYDTGRTPKLWSIATPDSD